MHLLLNLLQNEIIEFNIYSHNYQRVQCCCLMYVNLNKMYQGENNIALKKKILKSPPNVVGRYFSSLHVKAATSLEED